MNLKDEKPTTHVVDRTDDGRVHQFLTYVGAVLNPVSAARLARDALIRQGIIIPEPETKLVGREKAK